MAILSNSAASLGGLSERSRQCIQRLLAYKGEAVDLSDVPKTKRAAVLVLLYEKSDGLRVLLTTRAKTLRTHPGQTALPGGKMDEEDEDVIETAYREAFEEVGLPVNHAAIHTVCVLRPFFAWTRLLVTPVVAILTDLSVLDSLKPAPGEVDLIFDHPLEALLDPSLSAQEQLVALNSEQWPTDAEYYNFTDSQWTWLGNSTYRMHRFRSSASAIKGLTAEILILVATVAYDPLLDTIDPAHFMELRKSADLPATTADGIVYGRE